MSHSVQSTAVIQSWSPILLKLPPDFLSALLNAAADSSQAGGSLKSSTTNFDGVGFCDGRAKTNVGCLSCDRILLYNNLRRSVTRLRASNYCVLRADALSPDPSISTRC